MKKLTIYILLLTSIHCSNLGQNDWQYYAQQPPGDTAVLFAPDLINHLAHSAPTFSPDGKDIYWSTVSGSSGTRKIWNVSYRNGAWSGPRVAPFSGQYHDDQPFLSYDGNTLYFASKRPVITGGPQALGLWMISKEATGWGEPVPIPGGFWTPSVTRTGTLYFLGRLSGQIGNDGICRAVQDGNSYIDPEPLPAPVNLSNAQDWCPFIAPDESYLLFSSDRPGGYGSGDIYISFRDDDGDWGEPVNLGPTVNTDRQERFPGVSPDGKYLFFTRWYAQPYYHDLYWIDAGVTGPLRN